MSSEFSVSSFDATEQSNGEHDVQGERTPRGGVRSLVAFYSLSGHTRALAETLSDAGAGELEEVTEPRARVGFVGELRALVDSVLRRAPRISRTRHDPADFDVLVLGGPVWAGRIAAPVRTYARTHGRRARRVAFFCTYDSDGAAAAIQELADLCGRRPEAVLAVPAHAIVSESFAGEAQRFLADLRATATPTD
jgi:hypothetical protein